MAEIELGEYEVLEDMLVRDLKIVQDTRLYRFTSDSVLLSRFAQPKKGDKIADFCAGSGIVALHYHALNYEKTKDSEIVLFEMQETLAALARKTAAYNDFSNVTVENCKLQEIPKKYEEYFSLILCNPPYERAGSGFTCEAYEKAVCRKEIELTLPELAKSAARALKFGGRFCLLHRADRLPEVCYELKAVNIEVKKIQFVAGKKDAKPYLVMVEGVKGGKPDCKVEETLVNER